jgi:hypothetical protein
MLVFYAIPQNSNIYFINSVFGISCNLIKSSVVAIFWLSNFTITSPFFRTLRAPRFGVGTNIKPSVCFNQASFEAFGLIHPCTVYLFVRYHTP